MELAVASGRGADKFDHVAVDNRHPALPRAACSRLVITVTGFTKQEREALRQLVTEQLGGRYLPDLVHRSTAPQCHTSHLVCKALLDAFGTPKFTRALEWGLPVVTWRWLVDSAHSGKLLPLGPYKTDSPNAVDLSHALIPLGLPLGGGGEGAGLPVKGVLADTAPDKQPVLSLKSGRGIAAGELEDVQECRDQVGPQPPQQARSLQQQQQWQEWQRRQALQQVQQRDQGQGQQQRPVGEAGQAWLSQGGQVSLAGSACSQLSLSCMLQPSEHAQQPRQQLQQQPQHLIQPLSQQQQQQQQASQGVLQLQPGAGAAYGSQSGTQPTASFSFFPTAPMAVHQDEQAPAWEKGGEELRGGGGSGTSTPAFPGRAPCVQGVQGASGDGASGGPAWTSWPTSQHHHNTQHHQQGAGDMSGSAAHQQCGKQCGKGGSGVCVSVSPLPMGCDVASPSFGSLPGQGGGSGDDGGEVDVEMSEGHDGAETRGRGLDDLIIPGTQALDSDDDPSSPASLLTYLHTKMRISGMPGPASERKQSQHQSLQQSQQHQQHQLQHPECSGETTSQPSLARGTAVVQQHGMDCCGDASCTPVRGARDSEGCQGGFDAQVQGAAMDVSPWPQGPSLASGVGAGHREAADSRGGDHMDLSSPLPFSFSHKAGAGDGQARLGGEDLESAEDDAKKAGASVLYSGFSRDLMDAAASPSPHGRLADAAGQAGPGAEPETCVALGMEAGAAHGVLERSGGVTPTDSPVPRGQGTAWGEGELPGTPDADWGDGATEAGAGECAVRLSQAVGQRGAAVLPEAAAAAAAVPAATLAAAVKACVAALAAPPSLPRAFPPPNGPLSSFIKPELVLYSRSMGPTVPPAVGQLPTAGSTQGQRGREAQGGRRAAGGVWERSVGRPMCSGVSTCNSGSGSGSEFEADVRTAGKAGPAAAGTCAGGGSSSGGGSNAGGSWAGGSKAGDRKAGDSGAGGSGAGCSGAVAEGSSGAVLVHIKPDPWAMEQEGLPLGPVSNSQRQLRRLQQGPSTSQRGISTSQQGIFTSQQGSPSHDPGEEQLEDSTDGEEGSGAEEDEGAHGGSHHDLPSFDLGMRFGQAAGRVTAGAGIVAGGEAATSGVGSVGSQAGDVRPQHKPLRRLQRGSQAQAHTSFGHESVGQLSGSCSQARSGVDEQAGAPDLLEDSEALLEDGMDAEGAAADVQSEHAESTQLHSAHPQSTQPQSAQAQSVQAQNAQPQSAQPQSAHPPTAHEQSAQVRSGQAGAGGVQVKPEPGLEGGRPVGPIGAPLGLQAQAARKGPGSAAAVVQSGGGAGAGAGGSGVGTESTRGAGAGGAGSDGVPSLTSALASARAARSAAATPSGAGASAVRTPAVAADQAQLGGGRGGGAGKAAGGAGQGLTPVGMLLRTLAEAAERANAVRAAGRGGSGMDAGTGGGLAMPDGEGGGGGGIEVHVLKLLARPPRGNTVKEHHGLAVLKGLEWAEQVQVSPLNLVVTCKERNKRTKCPIVLLQQGSQAVPVVAEPFTIYCKEDEYWMEFHRLLTPQDIRQQAADTGAAVTAASLPADLLQGHEVLREMQRQHVRLSAVCGEVEVLRTKKLPSSRLAAATLYQRFVWDSEAMQVLTDAPASDFIADQ